MYTKAGSRSSRCVYRINALSTLASPLFEWTLLSDSYLRLGAVVHKLMGHKNAIVSVSFTTDCNMAITGKGQMPYCSISSVSLLCQASQDGLLSAWSTLTGVHLATFHFNQNLVKLLVAPTGGRILVHYSARVSIPCSQDGMRRSCKMFRAWRCLVCSIFHRVMLYARTNVSSQVRRDRSNGPVSHLFYLIVSSEVHPNLLPIKPKPLLYPKDSTLLTDSRLSSKTEHLLSDVILVSCLFRSAVSSVLRSACEKSIVKIKVNRKIIICLVNSCLQ